MEAHAVDNDKIQLLKERFVSRLPLRIDAIAEIAGRSAKPDLELAFHSLTGTAATYGLTAVAAIAREGEEMCGQPFLDVKAAEGIIARLRDAAEARRILCVEDDPDHADYLAAILEESLYQVKCVSHAAAFDDVLASFRPDLLILDVGLPDVSGIELARRVRLAPANATLPIIVLTSHREIDMHLEGLRAGADEYLVKPVSPHLLQATVASRLERSRLVRSMIERDGLTGLMTGTTFRHQLDGALHDHSRGAGPFTLVAIDIDHFKSINDSEGHASGDATLVLLATFLIKSVRRTDPIGRPGGDELAILLRHADSGAARRLVENVLDQFGKLTGRTRRITFSAGMATLQRGDDVASWMKRADDALYAAKRGGRARVEAA